MALNPPIESLPIQKADRDGHLQRYLSGLPNFGSWQDQGEGPAIESNETRMDVIQDRPISITKTGMDVIQDREAEAAERRSERRLRRREKAAILKPKPPTPSPPEELDQEWWDNYRAQKQGLLLNKEVEVLQTKNMDIEVEKAEMIMEKKENRRLQKQSRIPRSKGRGSGKGKGIPGIEIIEAYKPMTTALGPRMTMKPETKKGMFANGKSSNPGVLQLLESTKASNPRVSSSQSTPGRLTMESPERDWRDQWIRKSSQPQAQPQTREVNDKLPDPGYTNSTSWRSTLPSSDGVSKPSQHSFPGGSIAGHPIPTSFRSNGQEDVMGRYMYRYPSLVPLESRRSSGEERNSNDQTYQYPRYPIPHDPPLHYTSNHSHHSQEHHPHLQGTRSNDGRSIYLNQSLFPQDPRSHQNHNQVYQEYNPHPQAYSPLPHHSLYPHSLPFSPPNIHPNLHARPHGDIPQTPIFQDRRNINTNLGMNIPPPFSTPGPSRLPNDTQSPQFHSQTPQWDSFDHTARLGQDQDYHQGRPNEVSREEGLEGFWKPRRLGHDGIEQGPHSMGMDIDQAPIFPRYDQHNHPALPPHYGPGQHVPEHHQHDPMNHYHHQHQLHDNTTSPPREYLTPRIQHQPQYHGSERRYDTPIPNLNPSYDQFNHHGQISGNLEDEGAGEDKEEEIMEFGASKEEWKLLWSDRKFR